MYVLQCSWAVLTRVMMNEILTDPAGLVAGCKTWRSILSHLSDLHHLFTWNYCYFHISWHLFWLFTVYFRKPCWSEQLNLPILQNAISAFFHRNHGSMYRLVNIDHTSKLIVASNVPRCEDNWDTTHFQLFSSAPFSLLCCDIRSILGPNWSLKPIFA